MNSAFEALRLRFRTRCEADRIALAAGVAAGDAGDVRALAHKLAGAAGTFGFGALSDAALLMEAQVADGERPDAELAALLDGLLAAVSEGAVA